MSDKEFDPDATQESKAMPDETVTQEIKPVSDNFIGFDSRNLSAQLSDTQKLEDIKNEEVTPPDTREFPSLKDDQTINESKQSEDLFKDLIEIKTINTVTIYRLREDAVETIKNSLEIYDLLAYEIHLQFGDREDWSKEQQEFLYKLILIGESSHNSYFKRAVRNLENKPKKEVDILKILKSSLLNYWRQQMFLDKDSSGDRSIYMERFGGKYSKFETVSTLLRTFERLLP